MKRWLWIIPFALSAWCGQANAESIWDRRDPRAAFLFYDNRARSIGDLLTISISETTANTETEQRTMGKTTDARVQTNFTGSSSSKQPSHSLSLAGALSSDIRNQSSRQFSGNAQLTNNRAFTDKLTVTVVDMMPNGNLIVEGYRTRIISGEERMLRITGIVRQADIGTGNTVVSGSVANFRISYLGRGPESSYVNQGWLSRTMNLLWPW